MPSSKTTTQTRRLAAIDIGTNSFHLIVAVVSPRTGRFSFLYLEKEIIRLGSGSTDMKYLSASAMDRGVQALLRFRRIADSMSAPIRAIATSAVREALNQDAFLRRVRSETGIRVEIASGSEEARLIHLGVLQSLPLFTRRLLLIDIGGGSTEFLVGPHDLLYEQLEARGGPAFATVLPVRPDRQAIDPRMPRFCPWLARARRP